MSARSAVVAVVLAVWCPAAAAADIHHAIEARLGPAAGALTVRDEITVSGRETLVLDIAPWQRLERVTVDGRAATAGTPARIVLPDKGTHRVDVTLRGRVPEEGRGNAVSGADGAFLPGYAGWLPDTGDARVTHRLAVEVPEPYRVVATGRLVSERTAGGMRRAVFASDRPDELPSLFAGPWRVRDRKAGALTLRTYLHEDIASLADVYLDASERYVRRYSEEIGAYPYPSFSVVSSPLPVGLGFPSIAYVGRMVLPLPFMRGRSLAHEVLHSWWGNGVAVDYRTGNWAEGLTTYMADYALAEDASAAAAREMRIGWLRDFAALPPARDSPVRAFRAKRHDAAQVVGYNKTAFIFHMLRAEIGAPAFAAGLRRFWRDHRFGTAGWTDLRAAFERAAGRDLGAFFAQWLDRPGAPQLSLGPVEAARDGGTYRLRFTVRQQPPFYRLTLPVRVVTEASAMDGRVVVDGASTSIALELAARPRELHVDPGFDVFRRLGTAETPPILRDVTLAGDVALLIAAEGAAADAARALAARLLDTARPAADGTSTSLPSTPVLIVGTDDEVSALLKRLGLFPAPPEIAGAGGTARAWTARRPDGMPVLVVAARDAVALRALLRPLPHYGRRSFVVFDGARAVRRGVWPLGDSPLSRRLGN